MGSTRYRLIQPDEVAAAAALAREAFDQAVAPTYQPEGVSEFYRYASTDALAERNATGHVTLVADQSGKLIGMLQLRERKHVSMLFVRPSHQRNGIGRGLLEAAITLIGDADCGLTVNSSPNAVPAYGRMGFHVTDSEQCVRGIRSVPMHRPKVGVKGSRGRKS